MDAELLDYLELQPWSNDPKDPLTNTFLNYCLPTLRKKFPEEMLHNIPEHHKKAIIACYIAAQIVYEKGLAWEPTIVDVLPILMGMMAKT